MKALLPEDNDFLNCTVFKSLLKYASSIPLYSEILEPYSSNLKTRLASECSIYKYLIQNYVKKLTLLFYKGK